MERAGNQAVGNRWRAFFASSESFSEKLKITLARHRGDAYTNVLRLSEELEIATGCGAVLVAHLTGGQGVAGSNPVNPTS